MSNIFLLELICGSKTPVKETIVEAVRIATVLGISVAFRPMGLGREIVVNQHTEIDIALKQYEELLEHSKYMYALSSGEEMFKHDNEK